jgi:hypothetical protein
MDGVQRWWSVRATTANKPASPTLRKITHLLTHFATSHPDVEQGAARSHKYNLFIDSVLCLQA